MIWLLLLLLGCKEDITQEPLCPEDEETFRTHVWEPVLGVQCVGCHAEGAVASGSDFVLDANDMLSNIRAFARVSDRILLKPTGQHSDGHGGGEVIGVGSTEYEALSFWVDWNEGECTVPEGNHCAAEQSARRLRRLSHAEYDRTIADLFGIYSEYGAAFAADPVVDGFANDAATLSLSPLLADQYRDAAERIASALSIHTLLPCDPLQTGNSACAALFIEDFGFRAFRRPLEQTDIDRYLELWEMVATEDGFEAGIQWVITAMLQSPHFLYRSELGVQTNQGVFELTDWEIATELSYSFWGTMPDASLFAAAEAGELRTAEEIEIQANRLASDPRALETIADMVEAWLHLDRLNTVSRDGLTPDLRAAMRAETRDLVIEYAASGATLADLMTATTTYVDADLAEHYGLETTGEVSLEGTNYGGLLTQGSVLTTHALPSGSSPIHRGVLVRERLLCEELPPPPQISTPPRLLLTPASRRGSAIAHTAPTQSARHAMKKSTHWVLALSILTGLGVGARWMENMPWTPVVTSTRPCLAASHS